MANIIRREAITHFTAQGEPIEVSTPVVLCGCGREVLCTDFTNTCECGCEYNWAGQALAPRSQWEESW